MRSTVLAIALASLLAGCSSDGPGGSDHDAARDGGGEARGDSRAEVGPEAGTRDAGPDGAVFPTVQCPNPPLAAPAQGTCKVAAGSGAGVLLRGSLLLPDRVAENGHLLIEGGKIACAGCDCSKHPAFTGATVVECKDGVVSPALINPHDHLGWTRARPVPTTVRYDHRHEWREGTKTKPAIKYPKSDYTPDSVAWGEIRMLLGGAASIMGEGGTDKLLRNLDKDNEGLGKPAVKNSTFPLGDLFGQLLAEQCTYPELPDPVAAAAAVAYVPHVAEGVIAEARNEFLCLSGLQPGGVDVTLPNAAFIHVVGLTATDALDMARSGTAAIWSPRSNVSLYGFTANVVLMDHLGIKIALGTDWTVSGSMNMLRELACADLLNHTYYGGYFSDRRLFEMATVNAAAAVGSADVIGQLKEGTFADVTIWNGAKRTGHAAVVRAEVQDVVLVMRGGEILYGDEALVTALTPGSGQGCEPLQVCGVSKKVCVEREIGKTLSALQASYTTATYDLFFCGTPTDEPTCVPLRPGEYEGTITAADRDGDGVPDAQDTCPTVFNPPRPMDGMKQVDTDGDKVGDECDVCPLDPNTSTCASSPQPNDKDADGVLDAQDNCPTKPNKDQKDSDGDKIGDACDTCPSSNPGGGACPYTIRELRDASLGKRPPDGTLVKIQGATVTAVFTGKAQNFGYFVREGKSPFEAIYIYSKSQPIDETKTPLQLGDVVTLEGKLSPYNNFDEITVPAKVVKTGSGDITPVALQTADLQPGSTSAEGWESQLVRVSSVTVAAKVSPTTSDAFWVSDSGSPCTGTSPACAKVGDYYYDGGTVDAKPAALAGQTFSSITGVVNGFKNDHTLDPRGDADLTSP